MVTTCFFCQNLLSDFIEGILPSSRHDEIKKHLDSCKQCAQVEKDLQSTLVLLHEVRPRQLTHELPLRIMEASAAGKGKVFRRVEASRRVILTAVPLLLFIGMMFAFPRLFPWATYLRGMQDESNFTRYFPLLQGATEIIDEQTAWFGQKGPFSGSLWEEGGLSPDEFEKAFQKKGANPAVPESSASEEQ